MSEVLDAIVDSRGPQALARRAALAVALLAGFYLLVLSLLLAPLVLVVAGALPPFALPIVAMAFLPTIVAGVLAVLDGVRAGYRPPDDSVLVSRADAPELWALVAELSGLVGTRQPEDLRLMTEPTAAVCEETRFLGVIAGKRHLLVGVPLLMGLSVGELRAVLCHELAHYAHGDTRLSVVVYRGTVSLASALQRLTRVPEIPLPPIRSKIARATMIRLTRMVLNDSRNSNAIAAIMAVNWLLGKIVLGSVVLGYRKVYLETSSRVNRRQEEEADKLAARSAGREATASALYRAQTGWRRHGSTTATAMSCRCGRRAACRPISSSRSPGCSPTRQSRC